MWIQFDEIKQKFTTRGICTSCKKKKTRTIDECQTVSPFNKNDDGSKKSQLEVIDSVQKKLSERIERFNKEGFVCKGCKTYLGY